MNLLDIFSRNKQLSSKELREKLQAAVSGLDSKQKKVTNVVGEFDDLKIDAIQGRLEDMFTADLPIPLKKAENKEKLIKKDIKAENIDIETDTIDGFNEQSYAINKPKEKDDNWHEDFFSNVKDNSSIINLDTDTSEDSEQNSKDDLKSSDLVEGKTNINIPNNDVNIKKGPSKLIISSVVILFVTVIIGASIKSGLINIPFAQDSGNKPEVGQSGIEDTSNSDIKPTINQEGQSDKGNNSNELNTGKESDSGSSLSSSGINLNITDSSNSTKSPTERLPQVDAEKKIEQKVTASPAQNKIDLTVVNAEDSKKIDISKYGKNIGLLSLYRIFEDNKAGNTKDLDTKFSYSIMSVVSSGNTIKILFIDEKKGEEFKEFVKLSGLSVITNLNKTTLELNF